MHWSTAQALAPIPKSTATPGQASAADPANYVLVGLVIEKVTGTSAAAAIDADLWTPLGLERLAYQDQRTLPEPIAAPGQDIALDVPAEATGRPGFPSAPWPTPPQPHKVWPATPHR